jgi:hypothetical protein
VKHQAPEANVIRGTLFDNQQQENIMAILIEMQYGKKLGLPEYSSHFSVS